MTAWYVKHSTLPYVASLVVMVAALFLVDVLIAAFLPARVFGFETRLVAFAIIVLPFLARAALDTRRPPKRYPGQPRF